MSSIISKYMFSVHSLYIHGPLFINCALEEPHASYTRTVLINSTHFF